MLLEGDGIIRVDREGARGKSKRGRNEIRLRRKEGGRVCCEREEKEERER